MTVQEIVDELLTVRIGMLRAAARAEYYDAVTDTGEIVTRLRCITVRVADDGVSGSSARMSFAGPAEYPGLDAVRAELARQIKAERKATASRIHSWNMVS